MAGLIYMYSLLLIHVMMSVTETEAAKILLLPLQIRSHMMEVVHAAEELPGRGHQLYIVLGDATTAPKSLAQIGINVLRYKSRHTIYPSETDYNAKVIVDVALTKTDDEQFQTIANMTHTVLDECKDMMADTALVDRVRNMNFDLAISDAFIISPCSPILAYHLFIPFISTGTDFVPSTHAVPLLPSFCPNALSAFTDNMSFIERLQNAFFMAMMLGRPPFPGQTDTELFTKFGQTNEDKGQKITALPGKCKLSLINMDPILGYPMPTMPRTVLVGGLSTKPAQQLSPDFEKIVQDSKHGVIVVSFGSIAAFLPGYVTKKFAEAFSRVEYTIIWRQSKDVPHTLSNNVFIRKWLPQNDLLGHPKTKLFITHSGNNGQFEALYHGVPMVTFPLWGDQPHNAHRIHHKGFGLKMSIRDFSANELFEKMEEVITNEKYRLNIQKASRIYRDRPMNARETSAFWIEHVLKYGSEHLKSAATDLTWYSYLMLDILLFFISVLIIVVISILFCLCFIFRQCKQRNELSAKKHQ